MDLRKGEREVIDVLETEVVWDTSNWWWRPCKACIGRGKGDGTYGL